MTKTANHDEEKPATPKPPTDRALIKAWLEEGPRWADQAKTAKGDAEYWRMAGHAEARKELADMLEGNRQAREAYVKEAADRLTAAATEAGEKLAELVTSWYKKAEAKADE
jgi:inactivated superfamily I helicase